MRESPQLEIFATLGRRALSATEGLAKVSSLHCNRRLDGIIQVLRMEAEGAGLAFVNNAATLPNQVEPVRPTRVSSLDPIVEAINERWKFDAQLSHARARDKRTFQIILWTAEKHFIAHVRLHLPHIGGMRLKNIDGVEADLVVVLLGELVQGGNLPPKRRSRIAAEHQDHRPVRPK